MDNQNNQQPRGGGNRNNRQSLLILLVCILVSMLCMSMFSGLFADSSSRKISYDEFIRMLDSGEVIAVCADETANALGIEDGTVITKWNGKPVLQAARKMFPTSVHPSKRMKKCLM